MNETHFVFENNMYRATFRPQDNHNKQASVTVECLTGGGVGKKWEKVLKMYCDKMPSLNTIGELIKEENEN